MLYEKRNEVIEVFRKNSNKYLSQEDMQETIISISYLFWNAKFVMNNKFDNELTNNKIDSIFQKADKETQDFVWNICNFCRENLVELNLTNIVLYLDKLTEEELVEVICADYEMYSRFSSSTPSSVSDLAIMILEEVKGKEVLDLCSYTGNFLSNYAKTYKEYHYTGIEINYRNNLLTEQKLCARRVLYKVLSENVLGYKFKKNYDKIFCNFPFMLRLESKDYEKINRVNKLLDIEFSKRITSDWTFISSTINALSDNGKVVAIMPNGGLFKITDESIRKELVEKGYIEAVISIPGNVFYNTGLETNLLVLSKGNKKIKFINASELYKKEDNKNILKIKEIFNEYKNEKDSNITKIVKIKDIENMAYSLLPINYMDKQKVLVKNPKKLKDIAEIFRGYQISSTEINQLSINKNNSKPCKVINITNINNGKINKDELTTIYPDSKKMDRYLLKDKDLLVSAKGTTNKFLVVEIENEEKLIASGNFNILRFDINKINPYYIKMFFESSKGVILLNSIRSGSVLPALNMALFREMEIPVPTIKEQNEAVKRYLAKLDEIEIMKMKLKALEDSIQDITDSEF